MSKQREKWTKGTNRHFAAAVKAMAVDIDDGWSFESALEHHAYLFNISPEALCHEWNLRKEDCR
jgi:hypothetical protein